MEPIVEISVYKIQAILYWILGVLILHLGTWHWLGWISVGYGWIVLLSCFVIGIKNKAGLFPPNDDPTDA